MSYWSTLRIGSSALYAQRLRIDTIADNIANVETTRTETGDPFQRKEVVFSAQNKLPFIANLLQVRREMGDKELNLNGVQVSQIVTDTSPGPRVYEPTHPDADKDGYVDYPNVNLAVEMTNLLSATRSYEANLSVLETSRQMAVRAMEIGR